ncbi:MAG: adenylate/guanylate cyclase domain-containing protein [Microcoleus sp. SU_5_6]|nr:adenylate/guanylate cyclase domain-containing protein [Microcoleus sp. SU_5_6]
MISWWGYLTILTPSFFSSSRSNPPLVGLLTGLSPRQVNTASRMESHGKPGCIQVTSETYQILQDKFLFDNRGIIEVKGKGKMNTYWLKRRIFSS